ncbi:MAG: hypothetical protein LKI34_07755 [Bifidobacterium tibiigranuli]|jgi:hypothetical protein|uniref:hypothetical protein n=1 Tax=Bifidobacterium tibiigranuli TaxID=2172043 RepID=UPI0026EFB598|nr:hypothetical protein [Bifidobacterium tibiigranuli]MCI1674092.1 hypothetical protein [Bifidobacterium tibiigranuli]MCI1712855.1 hypothetical protein [Bifidobacterium tibiigranuli]MCI1834172.1 hypothetical protein [Bifidobacterium tibiigranuli]
MDITNANITAAAIVGFLSPVSVQVGKRFIPQSWTEIYSVAISALLAVIGVTQTVYATVNTAASST